MSVDLHPEDLLEREARGELLPAEREHLERHLRQCKACRFERLARADFQRESERSVDGLDVHRLLANALAGRTASIPPRGFKRRHGLRPRRMLLAAAIALIAGTAGATIVQLSGSGGSPSENWVDDRKGTVTTPPESAPHRLAPAPVRSTVESDPNEPGPPQEVTRPTESPISSPALPGPPATTAIASDPVAWQRNPASVFSRANEARRSGDTAHADSLYRLLIARHAGSPEAHHAQALLGQMLLDSGDPAAALRFFDDYLRKDGALREDVLLDRTTALQRLGRADEETAAWAALLGAYPESVHAARARGRLSELGKR